jgi:DNA-binding MarR family transcriptional regulator
METIAKHFHKNAGPLSGLEVHLGYWLRRVSNHVSAEFARALQARQVSVAEWVALRLIQQQQKLTPAQLADLVGMTRGAISKVVEKLEGKGWIVRSSNVDDNRSQWLSLTRQGRILLPKLAKLADKNDEHFFGCLDKEEHATLRHLLQKLTDFHRFFEVPVE